MTAHLYHPPRLTLAASIHQRRLHHKRVLCVVAKIAALQEEITALARCDACEAPHAAEQRRTAEERLAFWRERLKELHK